jgi:hypothetical protein
MDNIKLFVCIMYVCMYLLCMILTIYRKYTPKQRLPTGHRNGKAPFSVMKLLNFMHTVLVNPLTPTGYYSGRTAPLTSRCSILNIYSANIRTEYFKHAA